MTRPGIWPGREDTTKIQNGISRSAKAARVILILFTFFEAGKVRLREMVLCHDLTHNLRWTKLHPLCSPEPVSNGKGSWQSIK